LWHFSRFVNKDSKISALTFDKDGYGMFSYPRDQKPIVGTLVENNGGAAMMLTNPNDFKAQVQYFRKGKWWYIELLPNTLATVCFED
jgi:hypothetical protein